MENLKFGIEIESLFLFHESRLRAVLPDYVDIVKTHTAANIRALGLSGNIQKRPYNSWGIVPTPSSPSTDIEHPDTIISHVIDEASGKAYRAYKDEPLNVIQSIISKVPSLENVTTHFEHHKQETYNTWCINSDQTILALTNEGKQATFPEIIKNISIGSVYDTYGAEFVSPPVSATPEGIQKLLDTTDSLISTLSMSSDNQYGITSTSSCAFHVHVGLDRNQRFSVNTVRHLAYLLICFEDSINRMHPERRRNIDSASSHEIISNRENLFLEGRVELLKDPTASSGYRKQVYRDLDDIKSQLFQAATDEQRLQAQMDHPDTTQQGRTGLERQLQIEQTAALIKILNMVGRTKGYVVNFSGLVDEHRPNTIEFRQHAGTLDAVEMRHWIIHCTELVRLASRYASGEIQACPIRQWTDDRSLETLWELMSLPIETRMFYRQKCTATGDDTSLTPSDAWTEADEFDIEDWQIQQDSENIYTISEEPAQEGQLERFASQIQEKAFL